jgi:hypothetical protein
MSISKRSGGKQPDIHALLKLHIEASARLVELTDVFTKSRDTGNLKVARQAIVQAQRLLDEVKSLEGHAGTLQRRLRRNRCVNAEAP